MPSLSKEIKIEVAKDKVRESYREVIAAVSQGSERVKTLLKALFDCQLRPECADADTQADTIGTTMNMLLFLNYHKIKGETLVLGYYRRCLEISKPLEALYEPPESVRLELLREGPVPEFTLHDARRFSGVVHTHMEHQMLAEELGILVPMLFLFGLAHAQQADAMNEAGTGPVPGHVEVAAAMSLSNLCYGAAVNADCDAILGVSSAPIRFYLLACIWLRHEGLVKKLHARQRAGPDAQIAQTSSLSECMRLSMYVLSAPQEEADVLASDDCAQYDSAKALVSGRAQELKRKQAEEYRDALLERVDALSLYMQQALETQKSKLEKGEHDEKGEKTATAQPFDPIALQKNVTGAVAHMSRAMLQQLLPEDLVLPSA